MIKQLMLSCLLGLGLIFMLALIFDPPSQASGPEANPAATPDVSLAVFATGLSQPVDISHAGDERLFVVERAGRIRVVEANGTVLTTPFLDIDARVGSNDGEQGLLGLVFHPDYASNGYFYVNYTNNSGDTRISRFQVGSGTPNQANPASELILLAVDQDFANHNGGDLNFGPDGYLYIGLGDGGSSSDPNEHAQDLGSLLGKMLRLDVNAGSPYAIPPDNPFTATVGARAEIWALGLRNPWRFSFDRLTGDLYIADVGQDDWEEVDFQAASSPGGENYGWDCYEGNASFELAGCGSPSNYIFPIHVYDHNEGCSITGGYVYRGSQYPALGGHYLFADFCSSKLWSLKRDGQGVWQTTSLGDVPLNPSSFGENVDGELFIAGYSNNGVIYRVTVADTPLTGLSANNDSPVYLGETTTLSAAIETGDNPVYAWAFGDGRSGSGQVVNHTYAATGTFTAIVTASNNSSLLTATTAVTVLTPILSGPPNPAISLLKTVSANTNCVLPGTANLVLTATSTTAPITVTYCYFVRNTGNITFVTHTLNDDQFGLLLNDDLAILALDGILTYSRSAAINQSVTNVAVWEAAAGTFTATATATATVTYIAPQGIFLPIIMKSET